MKTWMVATWPLVIVLLISGLIIPKKVSAEMLLNPGDRISLEIIGVPEFGTVADIEIDGTVNLPVVGRLVAAGRTVDTLQVEIAKTLSLEPLRLVGADNEIWLKIEPSKIFVTIAEYRPVYVTGDVQVGGEKPFRPGMTALQALVLAGGIGEELREPSSAELGRATADRLLVSDQIELANTEVNRLKAEISVLDDAIGQEPEQTGAYDKSQLSVADTQLIFSKTELRGLNAETIELSLQEMHQRLKILEELEGVNADALEAYELEYKRISTLAERGVATLSSATESQQRALTMSSRALETIAETYDQRVDIAKATDANRVELLHERIEIFSTLIEQNLQLKELEARRRALDARYSILVRGKREGKETNIGVVIYRRVTEGMDRIDAGLDAEVLPGDVIEFLQIGISSN